MTAQASDPYGWTGNETTRCEGEYAPVWVDIHDARQLEPQPSLERDGFQLCRQVTAVSDLYDDEQVRAVYYPEMERLVKEMTGAAKVVIFDHNARDESKLPTRRANCKPALIPGSQRLHGGLRSQSGPQVAAGRRGRGTAPGAFCVHQCMAAHSRTHGVGPTCPV